MSLEQTTELYASVLRQLLPEGVYDTAEMTHVADDIYAHAKALAQADIDAHRLLQVLETIPVDLLADYEREYGLPMQCMVPGSQTIEERISVLRWIRQHRNVMNREYLEQILAIFGVTLVDVIKHRPMLCTAPCTSPVNTERLRYKVLLRLQYPMTADMSCIIENYLAGYLMIEWVVDMPWGEWIISPTITVNTTGIAHYTAYKTNQREYYDSYANWNLKEAIVSSLTDGEMQQWQAVKNAISQLSGVTSWNSDPINSRVSYVKKTEVWQISGNVYGTKTGPSPEYLCFYYSLINADWGYATPAYTLDSAGKTGSCRIQYKTNPSQITNSGYLQRLSQTSATQYLTFNEIADKIIAHTSSTDQGVALFAETYLETIAKSIFNLEQSKQFVKTIDLIPQIELNKTLRT
jgi:uncharacterized protein YmfQ (DUF2313 family)